MKNNVKKVHKGKLTEEQLAKMKKEIRESLAIDRHSLIGNFPFTAAISMRLDLVPSRDKRNRTACTDGKRIFFDCAFYLKLTKAERMFVLAHEIWHCVMLHLSRCQTRNRALFNIATDMEVNNLLVENAKGKTIEPPDQVLFPPTELKGKSAEVIYEWLLKEAKKQQRNGIGNGQDQNSGQSSSDNVDGNQANNNENNGEEQTSNTKTNGKNKEKSKSKRKSGKDTGDLSGQFDKHTYAGDDDDDDADDEVTDQWGEVGYDEDFRPSVPDDIAEQMREAAVAAAQQYQREKGDLPAGIQGILDKIHRPEINWKEYLSQFVTSCYNGARRWLPPNRRHVYNETYLQSRRSERIEGVVAIDTSGSCIEDLPKFFGELKGLVDSFGNYRLTVICADAAVDQVDIYDANDNPLEIETASDIKWSGGGGTDYGPVFKYVDKECLSPDFLIYIGDGYADLSYSKKPSYPVMWLLTKDGNEDFCKWGKKVKFKESSYGY